jgi:transposase
MRERKKQLSNDIRQKICSKHDAGRTANEISKDLDINYDTVNSVLRICKTTGRINAKKQRAPKSKKVTRDIKLFMQEKIQQDVSITLNRLKECILIEKGFLISRSTIDREISNFNFSLKRVVRIQKRKNLI